MTTQAAHGTHVLYNGVHLYNCLTRQWDEEMVYDDSGTDLLYHRYRLRFEGIVHSLAVPSSEPVGFTRALGARDSLASRYADLRVALAQPRQAFSVSMQDASRNFVTVLRAEAATTSTSHNRFADVDNGPKPHNVTVTHVAGLNCWRVAFSIDVCLAECAESSTAPFVLGNRWSVSEEMDDNGFITRTFAGRLRLAISEALVAQIRNQAPWRRLVVPSLEHGFRRDRMEFSTSVNGLECDYRVVDRQVHTAAPWPATKIEMTHTESTGDGLSVSSECTVRLEGPPHVNKQLMIMRAVQCLDARLNFLSADKEKPQFYVEDGRVVDHIGDRNVIEVSLRLRRVPEEGNILGSLQNISTNSLGKPLKLAKVPGEPAEYSPSKSPLLDVYGYTPAGESRVAVVALFACYLQTPCGAHAGPQPSSEPTSIVETPPGTIGEPPGAWSDILSRGEDDLSDATRECFYTYAAMHSEYITNACRVALPKAASPRTTSSGNTALPDTVMTFQLGAGICYRRIVFDAERAGRWPQIPEPVDTFEDGKLKGTKLDDRITPHAPSLAKDRETWIYRVHGEYLYLLNRPVTRQDQPNTGVLPFIDADLIDTIWEPNQAYDKFLGP